MFFICSIILLFFVIITILGFNALRYCIIPEFLNSRHAAKFKVSLSRAISQMMFDIRTDVYKYLEILCDTDLHDDDDDDVAFVPETPPPKCDFVSCSPKEEIPETVNNNAGTRRGRGRARGRAREMPVPVEIPAFGLLARRGMARVVVPPPAVVRLPRLRRPVIPPEIEIVDLADEPPPDMNRLPVNVEENALLSPPPQARNPQMAGGDGFRFAD